MATFVVLGATGRTGGATARALLDLGHSVRALTRRADSRSGVALAGAGAEVIEAQMENEDSLVSAFRDARAVFSVQPAFDSRGRHQPDLEIRQGTAVAAALRQSSTQHVVFLSAGPGHRTGIGHFDTKIEIEAALRDACPKVTVLRPAPFMELMTDPSFLPAVSTWGTMPKVVGWDTPIPWVAVRDVGRVAALALSDPTAVTDRELLLAGDVCTLRAARRLVLEAGVGPRRTIPVPVWIFRRMVGAELVGMWRFMRDPQSLGKMDPAELRSVCPEALTVQQWVRATASTETT